MSNERAAAPTEPNSGVDPYQRLQIACNPDGSITRLFNFPDAPPSSDPKLRTPVLSKDITINQSNNTYLRLFLPHHILDQTSPPTNKLPLVVFYHGGGFVLLSAASTIFHNFCANFATDVPVIIASVEYRLAPEHRLPAAYDDATEALQCIKNSQDDWLRNYADLSKCFLMGSSAGANIAYNAGLRVAADGDDLLHPLKIRGLILIQPFFGGIRRTSSESRLVNDPVLAPSVCDLMWDLSLPIGADRDHKYCNPMAGGDSNGFDRVKELGWRVLVTGSDGDPLVDRQIELVKMLEGKGVIVVSQFTEGGYHGAQDVEPSKAKEVFVHVKHFIYP
ncbi:carboxylesterase 1-like [Argentina anserina]|uniref:carboxylesterase 1-like n=1 Tax=Argentina anserina TaxID=57926 RepID=UPI0021767541|nr:carboxylesterase 1-like [Potentilla anserina]